MEVGPGANEKAHQTLRFQGRESPSLRAYDFRCVFATNLKMSLVSADLNNGTSHARPPKSQNEAYSFDSNNCYIKVRLLSK